MRSQLILPAKYFKKAEVFQVLRTGTDPLGQNEAGDVRNLDRDVGRQL